MSTTNYVTKEQLDESMKALEKKFKKINAPPRAPREPSNYNKFVKDEMVKVKKDHPGISNPDALKECAKNWNKEKEGKVEPKQETKA